MANDIVVRMQLENQQFVSRMNSSSEATQRLRNQTMQLNRAQQQSTAGLSRNNEIMRNAIYLVEDASSVYGTSGLTGVLRATSNNITMMAMAFGGLKAAAIGIAITALSQLYLAFTKTKEKTKEQRDEIDKLTESVNKYGRAISESQKFQRTLQGLDSFQAAKQERERQKDEANRARAERIQFDREARAKLKPFEEAAAPTFNMLERYMNAVNQRLPFLAIGGYSPQGTVDQKALTALAEKQAEIAKQREEFARREVSEREHLVQVEAKLAELRQKAIDTELIKMQAEDMEATWEQLNKNVERMDEWRRKQDEMKRFRENLQDDIDPKRAPARRIERELQDRLEWIRRNVKDAAEQRDLTRQAELSALAQRNRLKKFNDKPTNELASGALRGSYEAAMRSVGGKENLQKQANEISLKQLEQTKLVKMALDKILNKTGGNNLGLGIGL